MIARCRIALARSRFGKVADIGGGNGTELAGRATFSEREPPPLL